ncbi:MAG: hypothetical protein R2774_05410 [Saprospiraceae bacterium]
MSKLSIIISIIIAIVFFIIGIIVDNIPYFTLSNEFELDDLLSILITIIIAISIPLYLQKWQENQRTLKDLVIDDIRELLKINDEIASKISNCKSSGIINNDDRKIVIESFDKIDRKIAILQSQIQENYPNKSSGHLLSIQTISREYWSNTTGDELMKNQTNPSVFSQNYYDKFRLHSDKFEKELKLFAHRVNKY